MEAQKLDSALHLPSLSIKGFRGISDLSIPRLGRVTLLVGENGVGKTTLLDAVRIYVARGSPATLRSLLRNREEFTVFLDEDDNWVSVPDFEAVFYGRTPSVDSCMSVGPDNAGRQLEIRPGPGLLHRGWAPSESIPNGDEPMLEIEFLGTLQTIPTRYLWDARRAIYRESMNYERPEGQPEIPFLSLGPNVTSSADIVRFWNKVALTIYEARAVQALQSIYRKEVVERVAAVDDETTTGPRPGRRMIAKIKGQEEPVPLRSLGDGAVRMFGVALALANSFGGILAIDEVENGIHHSAQADFWRMVIQTSYDNNVQVIATTHSWDCVVGFAKATAEIEESDGVLYRIESNEGRMRAVEYSERNLIAAAKYHIETR